MNPIAEDRNSVVETPFEWTSFTETFKSSIWDIKEREPIVRAHPNALINLTRFMIEDPKVVTRFSTMWTVVKLFHNYSLRHLPVIDEKTSKLVGIITRENIYEFD